MSLVGSILHRTHGNQVTNDASVACNLSSQPNTSYVPQHTPTVNSTLPPKGVSKHHPNLYLGPTTINFSSFPVLETAVSMDVFKQQCSPVENPLSIPMALTHHHYSEQTMQTSVHFSYLRGMEQLKEKQEKFYAARQQRIQLQEAKLNKVNHLPKCCER